jgi:hypothetical protein
MIKSAMATALVAILACNALAQDQVILSSSNYNPLEGTTIGRTIGEAAFTKAMYVWVTANTGDEIAPQTVGYTDEVINGVTNHVPNSSAGIDLSYTVSNQSLLAGFSPNTANVFLINGGSDYNPALTNGSNRWDAVSSQTLGTPAASISDINAIAASVQLDSSTPPNIVGTTTGFRGLENVNAGSNSALSGGTGGNGIDPASVTRGTQKYFLLGEVDLSVTAFGTAKLAISEGSLGIFQGSTDMGPNGNAKYSVDSQTVTVTLLGDSDLNGQDNQADLNAVTNHWQAVNQTWASGDFDYNGQDNQADLNAVTNHWQQSIVGSSSISSVPEPGSIVLLGLGSLALLVGGRKIRCRKEN